MPTHPPPSPRSAGPRARLRTPPPHRWRAPRARRGWGWPPRRLPSACRCARAPGPAAASGRGARGGRGTSGRARWRTSQVQQPPARGGALERIAEVGIQLEVVGALLALHAAVDAESLLGEAAVQPRPQHVLAEEPAAEAEAVPVDLHVEV